MGSRSTLRLFKGQGVKGQVSDFTVFHILTSLAYLLCKMGQLFLNSKRLLAEIQLVKVGAYLGNIGVLYGTISNFASQKFVLRWFFGPSDAPKDPIFVFLEDCMIIQGIQRGFSEKLIFWLLLGSNAHKKSQKIKKPFFRP